MMANRKAVKPVLILGLLVALSKALGADYRLPGAPSMPKLLILGLLSLGMATLAPAAQRGGGPPRLFLQPCTQCLLPQWPEGTPCLCSRLPWFRERIRLTRE
jgi:hypothetical protein